MGMENGIRTGNAVSGLSGNYREMSGMSGGTAFSEVSVFLRRLDEQYQFFYEVYEESSVATGQSWNIQGFYLTVTN